MEKQTIYRILEEAYFSEHPHEETVLKRLSPLLPHVRHFVDVGASLGQFTRHANRGMLGGRIDTIEADPIRFEKLTENCALWNTDGRNTLVAHHFALAARSGEVTFFSTGSNVSGALCQHPLDYLDAEHRGNVEWQGIRVPASTLDALFGESPPDFVKMDIEGGELDALRGAQRVLAVKRTRFLIELHDFAHEGKPAEVLGLMRARGYVCTDFEWKAFFQPATPWGLFKGKIRSVGRRAKRVLLKWPHPCL